MVKKAKKYNYTKDCEEQPEEIPDEGKKKSLKPLCVVQDIFACTYEHEETCRDKKKQHCHKVGKVMGILRFLNNGYNLHQKKDCYILSGRLPCNQLTTNPEISVWCQEDDQLRLV